MITYAEQREKIVQAYLKCEIKPSENCACFVGNILNNTEEWSELRGVKFGETLDYKTLSPKEKLEYSLKVISIMLESKGMYSDYDIVELEFCFLDELDNETWRQGVEDGFREFEPHPNYENALYSAMNVTLEKLRKIHLKKGDVTAIETPLQKRKISLA